MSSNKSLQDLFRIQVRLSAYDWKLLGFLMAGKTLSKYEYQHLLGKQLIIYRDKRYSLTDHAVRLLEVKKNAPQTQ